jgi:hypothetical protein
MGVDCGFDIYPPLERTQANQERYEFFLHEVLVAYRPQDNDNADQGSSSNSSSVWTLS